ncbi:MAG: hypothetical protein ACRC8Y_12285 [Chroococcales cyanobacterium]
MEGHSDLAIAGEEEVGPASIQARSPPYECLAWRSRIKRTPP